MRLPSTRHILLAYGAVASLALALFCAWLYRAELDKARAELVGDAAALSALRTTELERWQISRAQVAAAVAQALRGTPEALAHELDSRLLAAGFRYGALVAAGAVVAQAGDPALAPNPERLAGAPRGEILRFGEGSYGLVVDAPGGVLVAVVERPWAELPAGAAYWAGRRGVDAYLVERSRDGYRLVMSGDEEATRSLTGFEGGETAVFDGVEVLAAVAPAPLTPWAIAAVVPLHLVRDRAMRETATGALLAGLLLIVAGGVFSGAIRRARTRYLERALAAERRLRDAEHAAQEAQGRAHEAQRAAGVGTFVFDLKANRVEGSDVFWDLLGLEPRPGFTVRELDLLIEEPDRARVAAERAAAVAAGHDVVDFEFPVRKPRDGALRWLHVSGRFAYAADRSPERALGTARDITGEREARAKLALQGAALGAASIAIMITNAAGVIEWVNAAFTELSGYSLEESVGQTPGKLLRSGRHDAAFYAGIWQTILAGKSWQGEVVNRRKDGREYPEELTITPVRASDGAITNFIAFRRDLTADKQREAQLLQSQKMQAVGLLAAGIAHNFNNILTGIQATAAVAAIDLAPDDPRALMLREIGEHVERASQLTRQLQGIGRTSTVEAGIIDVAEAVNALLPMVRRLLGADVAVSLDPGVEPAGVAINRDQFDQVFLNLVTNARDAMPTGGAIAIAVALGTLAEGAWRPGGARDWVRLDVRDTGLGMAHGTVQRIFEPFFSTKPPDKGTGLGLSTVYAIVTRHGGRVEAKSALGEGTTITILLPYAAPAPAHPAAPPAPAAAPHGGGETVLVVDDEDALRRSVCALLAADGYVVLSAANGAEAIDLAAAYRGRIDLVVTDTVMPGIGGPLLAAELARARPGLKALHMSALEREDVARRGDGANPRHFIQKPFTREQLARAVREALDDRAGQAEATLP